MKYAIEVSYYHFNSETNEEYEKWVVLGLMGEKKIFVFDDRVCERTKLFNTAKEAGEYVDKHFSPDKQRCCFSTVRIVEVEEK